MQNVKELCILRVQLRDLGQYDDALRLFESCLAKLGAILMARMLSHDTCYDRFPAIILMTVMRLRSQKPDFAHNFALLRCEGITEELEMVNP